MKKMIVTVLLLMIFSSFITGCKDNKTGVNNPVQTQQPQFEDESKPTLRIVAEYGLNNSSGEGYSPTMQAIENIIRWYKFQHPEVSIELIRMPSQSDARNVQLQALRTELMAGGGPDIFLMPTGNLPYFGETGESMPHLFVDVEQKMRSGFFYNLSEFFDFDEEMNSEELHPDIMSAGMIDDERYILPLGWNTNAVFVGDMASKKYTIDWERVKNEGCFALQEEARENGDAAAVWSARTIMPFCMNCFPNIFDYDNEEVVLTEQEIVDFLIQYQKSTLMCSDYRPNRWSNTVMGVLFGDRGEQERPKFMLEEGSGIPFKPQNITGMAETVGLAKCLDIEMTTFPLGCSDGSTIADITYWGAINANTHYPAIAYDFLRLFLLPEVQFETGFGSDYPTDLMGSASVGYPVRIKNSVAAMWEEHIGWASSSNDKELQLTLLRTVVSDQDLPLLTAKIDHVRFPNKVYGDCQNILREIMYSDIANATEDDFRKAAKECITLLKYHIAES